MGIDSSSQERQAIVFQQYTYTSDRNVDEIASSKWAVDPPSIHAKPGDTVRWTVDDSPNRDIYVRNVHGVFESIDYAGGNTATAKIKRSAVPGHRYVYRFFWGIDEAQGGSAPGVIID